MAAARPRKVLFHTPNVFSVDRAADQSSIVNKIQFEQDAKMAQVALKKGLHQQRLKKLRKLVEELPADDWKYPSFESLIGLK